MESSAFWLWELFLYPAVVSLFLYPSSYTSRLFEERVRRSTRPAPTSASAQAANGDESSTSTCPWSTWASRAWRSLIGDLPHLSQAVATDCQDQVFKSNRSWRNDATTTGRSTNELKRSTWSPVRKPTLQLRCNPLFFPPLFCVRESCFRPRSSSRCGGARRSACFDNYRFHDGRSELDTPQKPLCFADSFEVEGLEVNRLVGGSTKIDRLPAAGGAFTLLHHRSTQLRARARAPRSFHLPAASQSFFGGYASLPSPRHT